MALRDQPYIPLYVQDLMTDEKLNNCCAATHGIYIKGLMCLMHKSENYGKILLQQKFKQTDKQSKNFAIMLVKHLPYTVEEIENAIDELIEENVCYFEGDYICQKRMIKDGSVSIKRSNSGGKGGKKTQENNKKLKDDLLKQKVEQNTEYEIENESEIINTNSSNYTNAENQKISTLQDKNKEKFERYEKTFFEEDFENFADHFKSANITEQEIKEAIHDFKLNKLTSDNPEAPYNYKIFKEWFKKYLTENRAKYVHVPKMRIVSISDKATREELHPAFKFYWMDEYTIEEIRERILSGEYKPKDGIHFDNLIKNKLIEVRND